MTQNDQKFLILADDLTGALDSGVQLSKKGLSVRITLDRMEPFSCLNEVDVLVIDTESRHLSKEEAYERIYQLSSAAKEIGIKAVYKKTDSGLRGNVGAELTALSDAFGGEIVEFVPAWPKMGRITEKGIHYINGIPLAESIFARDVLNPVEESDIRRLIAQQSSIPVSLNEKTEKGILLYDCRSDEEMDCLSKEIFRSNETYKLIAGCAGLLEKIPLESTEKKKREVQLSDKLIVLSGSLNDVTIAQLAAVEKAGACCRHIPMEKVVRGAWSEEEMEEFIRSFSAKERRWLILDSLGSFKEEDIEVEDLSETISLTMGRLADQLREIEPDAAMMVIGGDTLQGVVKQLNIRTMEPEQELERGIVLSHYTNSHKEGYLISKSGAFGSEDLLIRIQRKIQGGF